jgi:hypothetical protein
MNDLFNKLRGGFVTRKSGKEEGGLLSSIESKADVNSLLSEFAGYVRQKTDELDTVSGQKAMESQRELSVYITKNTRNLMDQGVSVAEIQDVLRSATDRVKQTYAPDVDDFNEEVGEQLDETIRSVTLFVPTKEEIIADFTAGRLNVSEFMACVYTSTIISLESIEILNLIFSDFGKNRALDDIIANGEMVVNSGGEAFVPEYLTVRDESSDQYSVHDPAIFQSVNDVQSIVTLLESFDQKTFLKRVSVKKLIKSGWLADYDSRSIKKESDYIINELWKEFAALLEVYHQAFLQQKGMFIFTRYEGEEEDDLKMMPNRWK